MHAPFDAAGASDRGLGSWSFDASSLHAKPIVPGRGEMDHAAAPDLSSRSRGDDVPTKSAGAYPSPFAGGSAESRGSSLAMRPRPLCVLRESANPSI